MLLLNQVCKWDKVFNQGHVLSYQLSMWRLNYLSIHVAVLYKPKVWAYVKTKIKNAYQYLYNGQPEQQIGKLSKGKNLAIYLK